VNKLLEGVTLTVSDFGKPHKIRLLKTLASQTIGRRKQQTKHET